ncbi:ring-opening amidohydrolase [Dactylosporangium siamense]|uniref:Cyanuric acid amidohydrolase n=1 Tax=Dactylosporangium siamense TaxID=685454 RepID=A0A919PYF2_9ACTN|nr:ring-opening amidohydrolase [Dactylosporangium siamense]GIG52687.1 cyanuric acid amidohydrolase [Dactylosporangium siamense]
MTVVIDAFDTAGPGDVDGLTAALHRHEAATIRRLALVVKTEGSAQIDDFSREYAAYRAREVVTRHGGTALLDRTVFLHSTGCEGAMTPFGYLMADLELAGPPATQPTGLALGVGRSRPIPGALIGTVAHAELVEQAVRDAMADAGLTADAVELAVVKTPLVSHDPPAPDAPPARVTSAYAKAVGALGSAVALGEVARERVVPAAFGTELDLYSRRTMVFSSSEAAAVEVLVLGNRAGATGSLRIASGLLADVLDADGVRRVLAAAGAELDGGRVADPGRVAALLVKSGYRHDGALRGARTTVHTSRIDADTHTRATMSGVAGSVLGTGRMFISANSVHQAPDGGGLCVAIVGPAAPEGA